MAQPANRNDPYRKFNFIVEIDGITSSSFLSVDGIETISEVIDYREGSEETTPRKLAGYCTFPNLTLRRGWTGNKELWQWRQTVMDGQVDRRSGSIVILDHNRQPVGRINFRQAWPCRWGLRGLDALAQETIIEEVELVVEDLRLE